MLKDGIVFIDGGDRIVVNQYSFCELIKHLLSHYVGISYEIASETVSQSHLAKPVSNAIEAVLLSHEYPYYWGNEALLRKHVLGKRDTGAAK